MAKSVTKDKVVESKRRLSESFSRYYLLYLMAIPGVVFFIMPGNNNSRAGFVIPLFFYGKFLSIHTIQVFNNQVRRK